MGPVRNVEDLMAAGHGYQRSMVLFAALKLGLFRGLAAGGSDASALARRIGADPGKLSILLDALAALGLVGKKGKMYRNAPVARERLLPGTRSMESLLLHHLDGWGEWGRLSATVRAGRRPRRGAGENWRENFIRGMEENARERAAAVAGRIPLRPGDRVLDLGGGPGTYAVAWADACPGARITVFDTPATLRVARKILREKGADGRVRLAAGDFLEDPLGGPYDFVWISQILHAFPVPECVKLLRRARLALAPGGRRPWPGGSCSGRGTASWTSAAGRGRTPSRGPTPAPGRRSPSSTRRRRCGSPGRSFGRRERTGGCASWRGISSRIPWADRTTSCGSPRSCTPIRSRTA